MLRFLMDNALSPIVATGLRAAGVDAVHVSERGMRDADDERIFELAAGEGRTLVSADTDFGALLARRQSALPSVVLFRHEATRRPERQVELLLSLLETLRSPLEAGSVVTIEASRVRIRSLPILPRG
jgi:predicted nuclease of predicted toxin-antitoxin system